MSVFSPRFHVHNLGCKVNRVEVDSIAAELINAGAEAVACEDAEVVVINTCTVTSEADSKTRKIVRKMLKDAPKAAVIVTGCAAAIDPDVYRSFDDRIIVESDKSAVPALALALLGLSPVSSSQFARVGEGFMSRAGIKIQDGCANACTYCIVHIARSNIWAAPIDDVLAEVRAAKEAGVGEVVLTGINLGTYPALPSLLEMLVSEVDDIRIRLSSIEPLDVDDELISLMSRSNGRICRHLHMPLQSGSSRTLREMGRLYTKDEYRERIIALRSAVPQITLTTDIIAGFPGESDEDFEESFEFCRTIGFSRLHVFRYSRRPGTPAASRDDQISAQTSVQRSARLRELGHTMRTVEARKRVGTTEHILIEAGGKAKSESYYDCRLTTQTSGDPRFRCGALVPARIVAVEDDVMICEPTFQ